VPSNHETAGSIGNDSETLGNTCISVTSRYDPHTTQSQSEPLDQLHAPLDAKLPLLEIQGPSKRLGGVRANDAISLSLLVEQNVRHGRAFADLGYALVGGRRGGGARQRVAARSCDRQSVS
jgi:hypothetical protein